MEHYHKTEATSLGELGSDTQKGRRQVAFQLNTMTEYDSDTIFFVCHSERLGLSFVHNPGNASPYLNDVMICA